MEYPKDIEWIIIAIVIIRQIAKSIRIIQLKKIDKNKIEAIAKYEKKSVDSNLFPPWKKTKNP